MSICYNYCEICGECIVEYFCNYASINEVDYMICDDCLQEMISDKYIIPIDEKDKEYIWTEIGRQWYLNELDRRIQEIVAIKEDFLKGE